MFKSLIFRFRHYRDGFDWRGNATFLAGRAPDPEALHLPGISAEARDEALEFVCEAFEIPLRQMHCLRLGDDLMDIYRSFNGMRRWDRLEFESLWSSLDALSAGQVPLEELEQLKTIEDVIRLVAARGPGRRIIRRRK